MNFYKHHLGDYDGHTAHLSWDEDMAYTRLIRVYYRREAPIPHADRYRLTRASSKAQKAAVDAVLAEFFHQEDGLWRQKRCDEEIAAYQRQAATNKRIAQQRIVNEPSTNRSPVTVEKREPNQNQNQNQIPEKTKPLAPTPSGPPPVRGDEIGFIPLADGTEYGVTPEFLSELEAAYPRVDGPQTLKEIRVWCLANPRDRKTRKGAARFLNSWFERVQNRGR